MKPGWHGIFNSAGFRDIERSKEKAEGVFRLAIVGDSLAMQMDLPRKKLYPARLETLLQRALPERRIECPVFAVSGYCASQELYLMQKTVLGFHPDAILWQFHLNDAADPVIDGDNGGLGRYYSRPPTQLGAYLRKKLDHIRKKSFLRHNHPGLRQQDLILQAWRRDQVCAVIQQVHRLSSTHALPVFVVVFPSLPEGGDWARYTADDMRVYRALLKSFQDAGLPVLDLMPSLKTHPVSEFEKDPADRWHLGPKGHLIMARSIEKWLIEKHVFGDSSINPESSSTETVGKVGTNSGKDLSQRSDAQFPDDGPSS